MTQIQRPLKHSVVFMSTMKANSLSRKKILSKVKASPLPRVAVAKLSKYFWSSFCVLRLTGVFCSFLIRPAAGIPRRVGSQPASASANGGCHWPHLFRTLAHRKPRDLNCAHASRTKTRPSAGTYRKSGRPRRPKRRKPCPNLG
jgi:hypothetical protein